MEIEEEFSNATYQIKRYEKGKIWINDQCYENSVIIWPHKLLTPWRPQTMQDLVIDDFAPVLEQKPSIVILGTGDKLVIPDEALMNYLFEQDIGVEFMESRAACHTYTILASEERNVAACIICF